MPTTPPQHFSIDNFRGAFTRPARGHRFLCSITTPVGSPIKFVSDDKVSYLCKSSALPSATIDTIELSYYTRNIKIPGKRTFSPITLTFLHHENYKIRTRFESWVNLLNDPEDNVRLISYDQLFATLTLVHYAQQGKLESAKKIVFNSEKKLNEEVTYNYVTGEANEIARYDLYKAFPTSLGGLQFSHDNDDIQTFDVEFQYQDMSFTSV